MLPREGLCALLEFPGRSWGRCVWRPVSRFACSALATSLRCWAVLPNPFATARGSAARARWLTGYDGLDRLTHADNTSNVTQRQYPVDKTGNRTGKQTAAGGAITPYTYPATSHRLSSVGSEARTYDAVGNPRTIGARQLTYDDRSRLAVFVNGSTTQRYQYTGQGLRVRKWTSCKTTP